ncbi:ribonuclease III [Thermosediminibacter oceani]|uniref:Ribonuclease 3 n=1 Tax=Thermosediminibacter oceani (strain ATCC BAA-1034 / DSM 16646 / JW/IW-1228P) TaxID=555079 RepID=D9S345_THEOJ|nr:ribonuclease III [Thermosediminibacter oceani]ADL07822.1 RNAse III [Thermosediminibacter oceani DSM 16646]
MVLDEKRCGELKKLQQILGVDFDDLNILNQAFIHPSYAYEKGLSHQEHNQRLEFLGDAVLELVISEWIYDKYPNYTEGELTKLRALLVCEESLAYLSRELTLGDFLIMGKGEEITGGREKASILADTFEALIGAMYLDKGFGAITGFVREKFKPVMERAEKGKLFPDYKTALQEMLQRISPDRITYNVIKEEGPDHNKTFFVEVVWKNKILGSGCGKSKKEAEQNAAKAAIRFLKDRNMAI